MRALTKIQDLISKQACTMPHFLKNTSLKTKASISILAIGLLYNPSAQANCGSSLNPGSVLGALTGAAVGKQVKGNQKTTATAVGAAVGALVGDGIYKDDCPRQSTQNTNQYPSQYSSQYELDNYQIRRRMQEQQQRQREFKIQREREAYERQQREIAERRNYESIQCPTKEHSSLNAGSVIGAVVGGLVGHTLTDGNQRTTATAAGAAVGAIAGNELNKRGANDRDCGVVATRNYNENLSNNNGNQSRAENLLSQEEMDFLDIKVMETMTLKYVWEVSLQKLVETSSHQQNRKLLTQRGNDEIDKRKAFVESRKDLFESLRAMNGESRNIGNYAPVIVGLSQIPTNGVVSLSALQAKEERLRADPAYNKAYVLAKGNANQYSSKNTIPGGFKVAY